MTSGNFWGPGKSVLRRPPSHGRHCHSYCIQRSFDHPCDWRSGDVLVLNALTPKKNASAPWGDGRRLTRLGGIGGDGGIAGFGWLTPLKQTCSVFRELSFVRNHLPLLTLAYAVPGPLVHQSTNRNLDRQRPLASRRVWGLCVEPVLRLSRPQMV